MKKVMNMSLSEISEYLNKAKDKTDLKKRKQKLNTQILGEITKCRREEYKLTDKKQFIDEFYHG